MHNCRDKYNISDTTHPGLNLTMLTQAKVDAVVDELAKKLPADLVHYPQDMKRLYDGKLWHELSRLLIQFANEPVARVTLPWLFASFIGDLFLNLSPEAYCHVAIAAASVYGSSNDAISILQDTLTRFRNTKQTGNVKAVIVLTGCALADQLLPADIKAARDILQKECKPIIDNMMGLDNKVHKAYYRSLVNLAKAKGDFEGFYDAAMSVLSFIDADEQLSADWCHDLIVSALLSRKVYSFAKLLNYQSVILEPLGKQGYNWLWDLIEAFNCGDVEKAGILLAKNQHAVLLQHGKHLQEKLSLMALAVSVFEFVALRGNRDIPLDELAGKLNFKNAGEAERLLLKAFAYDILSGKIDGLNNRVHISNVQPRHLSMDQIAELQTSFEAWRDQIDQMIVYVRENAPATVAL